MSNLKKKNIIVTGASGGIGSSIIKKLSEEGANILATGTRIEKLEDLAKNLMALKLSSLIFLNMKKLKNSLMKLLKN